MDLEDTIVALSSPAGPADRAIVRLSGPAALALAARFFCPDAGLPPDAWSTFSAQPGRVRAPGLEADLPATLYLMRAPRSYTRQDVAEVHLGGWPAALAAVLDALVAAGARPAEPGEFTYRALASGRLDLAQAEAVMAVIAATGERALRAAGDLLAGHLSREVAALADRAAGLLARVEAGLDFSDQEVPLLAPEALAREVRAMRDDLVGLGRRSRSLGVASGRARLVLAGWPNVGKSSLFNRLLREDRAIVSPRAGTTRDELRAALHLGDVTAVLSDTAGLDEAAGGLAGRVRTKALEALGRADLVLLCLDATAAPYDRTEALLDLVAAPLVVAVTKTDLAPPDAARAWAAARGLACEVVATSAATGAGVGVLREALARAVSGGAVDRAASGPVVTARHRSALEAAAGALARAEGVAAAGAGEELAALELREALDALGRTAGRHAPDDVLGLIFRKFCVGK